MVDCCGLLYVSDGGRTSPNLRADGQATALQAYLANAVTLDNSLKAAGCRFTLLTNARSRLEALNARFFASDIAIREIPFAAQIPGDIPFFAAHHKLDVYRWFAAGGGGDYALLVDLDAVALRPPSGQFTACIRAGMPMLYDISDQVLPLHGEQRIMSDLTRLAGGALAVGRWYGGEFIGGPPRFFARLVGEIDRLWDRYCGDYGSFYHQGDETPTSAALCKMISEGCVAADVGPIGGVGRYWSWLPLQPQKPFWWFEECFLLHLPNDKHFLAAASGERPFRAERFLRRYRRHLAVTRPRAQLRCLVKVALRKRHSLSARLECRRLRLGRHVWVSPQPG